ncbi:hypothetical protein [Pseudomonas sp. MF6396]|uniref:hypothetical protein n=1 Tax=Pseudomonas sp. MF6396 TaxID=1960828 RepID=UPI003FD35306
MNIDPNSKQCLVNWKNCKSIGVAPRGNHLTMHLTDVVEAVYNDLRGSVNKNDLVASGWIVMPADTTLDETQTATTVFVAVGAWYQQKATSNIADLITYC